MTLNPLAGFHVDPAEIEYIGQDLQRPECILAERDGTLWSADARGGVVRIAPDGTQKFVTNTERAMFSDADDEETRFTEGTLPNGLAFAENGDFLIANFGTDLLERMTRNGETQTLHDSIDGKPMGKVNFVLRDSKNRLWLTISTRATNRMRSFTPDVDDAMSRWLTAASSASSPMVLPLPMRSASMPKRNFSMWWRLQESASRASALAKTAR